jgi:hypothetical protein
VCDDDTDRAHPCKHLSRQITKAGHKAAMALDIDYTRRNKKARLLTDGEKDKLDEFVDSIHYSSRYGHRATHLAARHIVASISCGPYANK